MAEWGSASTPAYCASKGGVKQLVKSFGQAVGHLGITCNAIGPGFIETNMTRRLQENPAIKARLVDRTRWATSARRGCGRGGIVPRE